MSYLNKYQKWLKQTNLDENIKTELLNMSDEEIENAFSSDLEFGTSGLRGIMGAGTAKINIYTIRKATFGFGQYLINNNELNGVAIAYDNRKNSRVFAFEAAKVLAFLGIKTYVFENLRPTPMLSFAIRKLNLSGGIIITASHNPKEYNGYKVYHKTGRPLNLEETDSVLALMNQVENVFCKLEENLSLINLIDESFDDVYLARVKELKINDTSKKIKILYSPLHGTGSQVIPKLLKGENYNIVTYEPQMIVDENFSNTLSSNPEEKIVYDVLIEYAQEIDADLIMVTDPDADRLGIAVKHQGEYHLLNGNQTAALELEYLLTNKNYDNGYVFSTIVTTPLIKAITTYYEQNYVETLTGFKFIAQAAQKAKQNGGRFIFGCEESYGSLISDFVYDKDAVQACYLLSEITSYLFDQHKTLVDYLDYIGSKYGYYYEETRSIMFPGLNGLVKMNKIMEYFKKESLMLINRRLNRIDNLYDQTTISDGSIGKISLPKSSVLKYYYDNNLQVILRPSGTEPKLKIYFSLVSVSVLKAKLDLENIIEEVMFQIEGVKDDE